MIVLGLGFTDHDASAAIVVDGVLKTAIARERLTRLKRDGKLFGSRKLDLTPAIDYCLKENRLAFQDVDLVVWNHIDHVSAKVLTAQLMIEGSATVMGGNFLTLPHHFAHACASFYLSPFAEAAVLVSDGLGGTLAGAKTNCAGPDSESVRAGIPLIQNLLDEDPENAREMDSFYHCAGGDWRTLRKVMGSDRGGIGARYGAISALLFGNPLDAGKSMGLAPYGKLSGDHQFLECQGPTAMRAYRATHGPAWESLKQQIKSWTALCKDAETSVNYEEPLPSSFAASMQHQAEDALLEYARWLRQVTGARNLCLSGGVALNCVANSRIARETGFETVFVPPAPGDDGIAVGCALYGAATHGNLRRGSCPIYLGRSYAHNPDELKQMGLALIPVQELSTWLAERLAEGAVVAWYQGGAELGPRALGHRSFLADPRRPDMRDYLNRVVKKREPFRPFAPIVLEHAVLDYFEEYHPSYFMSFVARVREEKRSVVPAITHVDGTSRYQILRKDDNPELHDVIEAFARRTGVPLLLNTSLNRAGEPIVETPLEAARCMLAASADYLVLDGVIYGRC